MTHFISRFWMVCLVPIVVPMAFLPIWVLVVLAAGGMVVFAIRVST